MNWLSVSATFSVKGKPRQPGISRETWQFAKNQHVPLAALLQNICERIVEFYLFMPGVSIKQVNEQLKQFSETAQGWQVTKNDEVSA